MILIRLIISSKACIYQQKKSIKKSGKVQFIKEKKKYKKLNNNNRKKNLISEHWTAMVVVRSVCVLFFYFIISHSFYWFWWLIRDIWIHFCFLCVRVYVGDYQNLWNVSVSGYLQNLFVCYFFGVSFIVSGSQTKTELKCRSLSSVRFIRVKWFRAKGLLIASQFVIGSF